MAALLGTGALLLVSGAAGAAAGSQASPPNAADLRPAPAHGTAGAVGWLEPQGSLRLPLAGDDAASEMIALGFALPFYGKRYEAVSLSANGLLAFESDQMTQYLNVPLPDPRYGAIIAAFWDDLYLRGDSRVYVQRGGQAGDRFFLATWHRAGLYADPEARISFQKVQQKGVRIASPSRPRAAKVGGARR